MTDFQWVLVKSDFDAAREPLSNACLLYGAGGFDAPGLDGYRTNMAFLYAMQCGHSSLEAGLDVEFRVSFDADSRRLDADQVVRMADRSK